MKIADRILDLEMTSSKLVAALGPGSGYMQLAEAPIFSDGSFVMDLPDIVLGYSYLTSPTNICENINIDPDSLKVAIIDAFWLFDSNERVIGYIFQGSAKASVNGRLGEKMVSRWYANQNSQLSGNGRCGPHGLTVSVNLNLKKGWNDVIRHFYSDREVKLYTCKNTNRMQWFVTLNGEPQQGSYFLEFNNRT